MSNVVYVTVPASILEQHELENLRLRELISELVDTVKHLGVLADKFEEAANADMSFPEITEEMIEEAFEKWYEGPVTIPSELNPLVITFTQLKQELKKAYMDGFKERFNLG